MQWCLRRGAARNVGTDSGTRWKHDVFTVNPLEFRGNYTATSNNTKLSWYTGRWWVGCYILYSQEVTGRGRSPPRPLLAIPNVTAHPSPASVPITVLLYNGPLFGGFNVDIKRLNSFSGKFKTTTHQLLLLRSVIAVYHVIEYMHMKTASCCESYLPVNVNVLAFYRASRASAHWRAILI